MKHKIGRNDLCWCGSGLKYKYCHLKREKQPSVQPYEMFNHIQLSNKKEYCLHPQAEPLTCKGKIIKAHTIQRNNGLDRIARDAHVYMFTPNLSAFSDKSADEKDLYQVKPIGIRNASTFTGFCAYHDTKIFEPIEKYPFQNTAKDAFLLGFRAISREVYTKRSQKSLIPFSKTLDRGKPQVEQAGIQKSLTYYEAGVNSGLRDIETVKTEFDSILLSNDYSVIRYYIIRFGNAPEIMTSGAFFPEYDFHGKKLQSLENLSDMASNISFSLIATDNGGAAVFCWLQHHSASEQFIRSLHMLTNEQLSNAIVRFAFSCFENVCISPQWWDALSNVSKDSIKARVLDGIKLDSLVSPNYLMDDGVELVNWNNIERVTNIS